MKQIINRLIAIVGAFGLCAATATAVPMNITVNSSGALLNGSGIANNTQYGQANNNPSSNLAFLNQMIGNWNTAFNPDLPAAGALALDQGSLGGVSTYSAPAGYQYVVFHFGAGQAGGQQRSPGGFWSAYYLGGEALSISALPQDAAGRSVGGFSSARYFGKVNVPDAGATLALLGLGMVGVGALRNRMRK